MSYIFIRHDKKKYFNGRGPIGSPRFDPSIDYSEKSVHEQMLQSLTPDRIFSSPFLRCRQTAERAFPYSIVEVIPSLGDYLGNWTDICEKDFDSSTLEYLKDFSFERSFNHFQKRIESNYKKNVIPVPKKGEVYLVVVHGTCLKHWYKLAAQNSVYEITMLGHKLTDGFKIDTCRHK